MLAARHSVSRRCCRHAFSNGERLYGFAGLRAFKAKYRPEWVPRYVAMPYGLEAPRALIDLVVLVGV